MEWAEGTPWAGYVSPLRLFRYITFRAAGAAITALLLSWWLGPKVIVWLKQLKFGQEYADLAEQTGDLKTRLLSKKGTPTMGGILIVTVLNLTALLWAQWNPLVELTLLTVLVLTGLGFYDDYAKIVKQHGGGAKPQVKLWVQVAVAVFVALYIWQMPITSTLHFPDSQTVWHNNLISVVMLPFYKYPLHAGAAVGLVLTVFTLVGSSNAVNLTDGLDGLAIGTSGIVAFTLGIIVYVSGNIEFSNYLNIIYLRGNGELIVFCIALVGAALGFLWYNSYPAQIFMGDTGSLALGGAIGALTVMAKKELILPILGGIFFMETVSVIVQRLYFKYTKKKYGEGRRIFKMAPIHHHFELLGWQEPKIVMRFYIIAILLMILSLTTFKVR